MKLTRRDLFRSAGAVGGVAAIGGLAAEAVAGTSSLTRTTRAAVLVRGKPGPGGWRPVVRRPGEGYVARDDLGIRPKSGRGRRRRPVLAFAQLSDIHVIDAQSPLRFEDFDETVSSSAWRPQEILSAQVADAMVRELNDIDRAPVTKAPLAFAIQTGDNSDNSQYNEIRWNIDVLDGGEVRPDSGDLTQFEGVIDGNAEHYDPAFWHPEGTPAGEEKDVYRREHGYPTVPGLLDACRRPFQAAGLTIPWYSALGNHDELVQGNFPQSAQFEATAVGSTKRLRNGFRTVTADPDRRLISRAETVEEHFTTTGLPVGHGFTETNRADGTAYYTFDQGLVRFIVLDTVNSNGGADGEVDDVQFAWLQEQLAASHGERLVIVASHHTSWTFTVPQRGERVVDELLKHKNVIAWVNGHTHRNSVRSHRRPGARGGFWEINSASHIDWPQQARLIEVVDNKDKTLSIFCTMVDHGAPLRATGLDTPRELAGLSRLLAANDPQEQEDGRRGRRKDRNVELLVRTPKFLRG